MNKHVTPRTMKEALGLGHQELSASELVQAKATFGEAMAVADCGTLAPGARCAETACVKGFKIVMYCDESNGCTHGIRVPC